MYTVLSSKISTLQSNVYNFLIFLILSYFYDTECQYLTNKNSTLVEFRLATFFQLKKRAHFFTDELIQKMPKSLN